MTFQFRDDISEHTPVKSLLAYIDELEAQIDGESASDAEQGFANLQAAFGATRREAQLLALLSDGRVHSKDNLMTGLYSDRPNDAPEIKIVDVWVCKLRHKLAGSGIEIETVWGTGYRMCRYDKLRAAMAGEPVEWAEGTPDVPVGRPRGFTGQSRRMLKDQAVDYLRSRADENGVVNITSRDLYNAVAGPLNGSALIRNLEGRRRLVVLEKPAVRGDEWVLLLSSEKERVG